VQLYSVSRLTLFDARCIPGRLLSCVRILSVPGVGRPPQYSFVPLPGDGNLGLDPDLRPGLLQQGVLVRMVASRKRMTVCSRSARHLSSPLLPGARSGACGKACVEGVFTGTSASSGSALWSVLARQSPNVALCAVAAKEQSRPSWDTHASRDLLPPPFGCTALPPWICAEASLFGGGQRGVARPGQKSSELFAPSETTSTCLASTDGPPMQWFPPHQATGGPGLGVTPWHHGFSSRVTSVDAIGQRTATLGDVPYCFLPVMEGAATRQRGIRVPSAYSTGMWIGGVQS
jgi:hypothetical protein